MQTDDLAAQMVREIEKAHIDFLETGKRTSLEAIARRYIEKLFTESELYAYSAYRGLDNSPDDAIRLILAERAALKAAQEVKA
jgi:hypothetical protein